jgi:hypothetical protein
MKEVKHRIMFVQMLFGDEFIIMVERLDGNRRVGVLICLRRVIVSSMLPYSCLQLSIYSAYADRGSFF